MAPRSSGVTIRKPHCPVSSLMYPTLVPYLPSTMRARWGSSPTRLCVTRPPELGDTSSGACAVGERVVEGEIGVGAGLDRSELAAGRLHLVLGRVLQQTLGLGRVLGGALKVAHRVSSLAAGVELDDRSLALGWTVQAHAVPKASDEWPRDPKAILVEYLT